MPSTRKREVSRPVRVGRSTTYLRTSRTVEACEGNRQRPAASPAASSPSRSSRTRRPRGQVHRKSRRRPPDLYLRPRERGPTCRHRLHRSARARVEDSLVIAARRPRRTVAEPAEVGDHSPTVQVTARYPGANAEVIADGRRADRAAGRRYRGHAVHVVAEQQRRLVHAGRDLRSAPTSTWPRCWCRTASPSPSRRCPRWYAPSASR